jgi:uncharacterized membrane protein YgcG
MRRNRYLKWVVAVAFIFGLATASATWASMHVVAAPAAQNAPSPAGRAGTVLAQTLNVRATPAINGKVVGQLKRSNRVEIVGQQGEWLQIAFPAGPGGKAWVSTRFIAVDGLRSSPTSTPAQPGTVSVPAPEPVSYRAPTFFWRWPGNANALRNVDWYFDVQIFRGTAQNPFQTVVIEPEAAAYNNGVYSAAAPRFKVQCGMYWIAQIAERKNGRFVGWISPKSARQPLGDACGSSGSDGGGGNGGGNSGGSGVPGDTDGDGVCDVDCGGQVPDEGSGVPGDTDGDGVCDVDCGDTTPPDEGGSGVPGDLDGDGVCDVDCGG